MGAYRGFCAVGILLEADGWAMSDAVARRKSNDWNAHGQHKAHIGSIRLEYHVRLYFQTRPHPLPSFRSATLCTLPGSARRGTAPLCVGI
ncbi:hypothetical protein HETIRDRAFT_326147 [Heterobasidion irregulare TC 32-1]|uniref:Uncharacterized protein n=1 Tax=Heterobasidion irregulare (strain TC 32-1) TaxID=747525 RepID=W4JWN6_HETIT|nr:uncharacterized protein HETIRDRAFT_326147 [Heterobasidion irregulare TC 32-1]ETW77864.1 hypothetical protein HETIRDRAFT_326147 [Heterobasidion irregulare TC 32-1]